VTGHTENGDPTRVTRIVCAQLDPVVGELMANQEKCLAAVRTALADDADIIVLPELATAGYVFESKREAISVAIRPDDPFFERLSNLLFTTDSIVILGFCEQDPNGGLFNSAAAVTQDGVVEVYRKTHLWDRETLIFEPGAEMAPVFETVHGRIGILICYDLEFAEMPRSLALRGADLIAVPTNWPLGDHPADERAAEVIYAQAAARANGVFIACCDRAGIERGQEWTEGTVIIDQFGWVRASATAGSRTPFRPAEGTEIARADVFTRLARDKAISPHNDLLGDRRPDIYARGLA
jgi:predicted amidohydrolase